MEEAPPNLIEGRNSIKESVGERREAEKFSPALARGWASTEECLGVKYDCFVLPTVLMPREVSIDARLL